MADEIRVEAATALGKILSTTPGERKEVSQSGVSQDELISSAIDMLRKGLSDACDLFRISCIEALGDIGIPQVFEPLLALLQDHSADVREAASIALAKIEQIPQDQKLALLCRLLENADSLTSGVVRASIIRTIYRIGGEKQSDVLMPFLKDPSGEVRTAVLEALITFPQASSPHSHLYDIIRPFLHDSDFQVRITAVQSLVVWGKQRLKRNERSQEQGTPQNLAPDLHTILLNSVLDLLS